MHERSKNSVLTVGLRSAYCSQNISCIVRDVAKANQNRLAAWYTGAETVVSAVTMADSKDEDEVDLFRNPKMESICLVLHACLAFGGFIVCLMGAMYALYYKAAFIILGCMMLFAGIGGALVVNSRNWAALGGVNAVHILTTLLLFIFMIIAGLVAFDIRDPVSESVESAWPGMRASLEETEFCVGSEMPKCALFHTWADAVADTTNTTRNAALAKVGDKGLRNVCPKSTIQILENCSSAAICDTSTSLKHVAECNLCNSECKVVLKEDLRGNVGAIGNLCFFFFFCSLIVLAFNLRMTGIAADVDDWNEYMEREAKRRGVEEYTEERMQDTQVQTIGMILNGVMLLVGLVVAILASYVLATQDDVFSSMGVALLLIGMAMMVAAGVLIYGAKNATTSILKLGNAVLLLICMLFLFVAMMVSMAT